MKIDYSPPQSNSQEIRCLPNSGVAPFGGHLICTDFVSVREDIHCELATVGSTPQSITKKQLSIGAGLLGT